MIFADIVMQELIAFCCCHLFMRRGYQSPRSEWQKGKEKGLARREGDRTLVVGFLR